MFCIKGQVQISHYQTCRHIDQNIIFATRVYPILSFYRIQNQIGSHIIFATRCIKGQVQTFYKLQNKGQFNTLILPNLNLNRFKYDVLNHGTSSTVIFIKIVTI